MDNDFCLGCGQLLPLYTYRCPICGFDSRPDEFQDISVDDQYLNNISDDFYPEEEVY